MSQYYNWLFTEIADQRTNDWLLINTPIPALLLISAYLYFVKSWGPQYMRNRKPYQLKNALIVYNLLQVLVNIYLFSEAWRMWIHQYSWTCEPIDTSNSEGAIRFARAMHLFYLTKLTDLFDTVFFVFRKKYSQLTFLHLYHHSVTPILCWILARYAPGGHGTLITFVNTFIHIIMYSYYLIAAMGPRYQKYLWWKKYITTLQMIQFIVIFMHALQVFWQDCDYPRVFIYLLLSNTAIFYLLFANFYKTAYMKSTSKKNEQ